MAANVGITMEDILKAADWNAESTFHKFYYKPVHDSSFARSILSNHDLQKSPLVCETEPSEI